jgi:hypothetical protein
MPKNAAKVLGCGGRGLEDCITMRDMAEEGNCIKGRTRGKWMRYMRGEKWYKREKEGYYLN